MSSIAIVYHSVQGHTEHIAQLVAEGARQAGATVELLPAAELTATPERLLAFSGLIFGSPTYLGGVTGVFKSFIDATGGLWRHQQLRGKLAAGFTVSALPSGDKQSTLLTLFTFSMQHGMLWHGNPILPEQHLGVPEAEAANRLGSWSGLMAQGGHSQGNRWAPGDEKTARLFGHHFVATLQRLGPVVPREDI